MEMVTVRTAKELGQALKSNESYIYVEGDLKNKIIRIKAVGKIAWILAVGSLATAISLYLSIPAATATGTVVSGPVGTVAGSAIPFTGSVVASSAAATILGLKSVYVAIGVGVAFGGVGGVVLLRNNYTIEKKSANGLILKKK